MPSTGCECQTSGWCPRHKCWKSEHFYRMCCENPHLFRLWEEGKGPGQRAGGITDIERIASCIHRGGVRRAVPCSGCKAAVMVKIFACRIHGECELSGRIPDVKHCPGCSDCKPSFLEVDPKTSR